MNDIIIIDGKIIKENKPITPKRVRFGIDSVTGGHKEFPDTKEGKARMEQERQAFYDAQKKPGSGEKARIIG